MTARTMAKSAPYARDGGGGDIPPPAAPNALPDASGGDGGHIQSKAKLGAQRYDFAPLPTRALKDSRLTGEHLRALGIVARHDGFGRNGTGCYAGDKTLAAEIGLTEGAIRVLLADLFAMEYVHQRPHPTRTGLRVLRVMYTDADRAVLRVRRPRPGIASDLPAQLARAMRSPAR